MVVCLTKKAPARILQVQFPNLERPTSLFRSFISIKFCYDSTSQCVEPRSSVYVFVDAETGSTRTFLYSQILPASIQVCTLIKQ